MRSWSSPCDWSGASTPLVEATLLQRLAATQAVATREASATALGLVGSKQAMAALQGLLGEESDGLRANAVWSLGRLDDAGRPAVRRALRDDAALVRDAAASALGMLEDQDAVDELLRVVRTDKVARVRRTAAWALGNLEEKRAGAGLVASLRAETDEEVRETIVWALGNIEATDAAPALADVLRRDANGDVREMAAWALGELEVASAAGALGEAAGGDAEPSVRATAAWALGQFELRQAPSGLIKAVTDRDPDVRTRRVGAGRDARSAGDHRTARGPSGRERPRRAQGAGPRARPLGREVRGVLQGTAHLR
ncbi:MAG: HEAT repeat domain-containing protein [Gemmatimonadetes bacterium]|nr:HEAT repeat domain-containing protein [Gemmatimonadota bacterium]